MTLPPEASAGGGTIHVVGYVGGGEGPPMLPPGALDLLAAADVVVGGRRHLRALAVPPERALVLGKLGPALAALAELPEGRSAVVVASGDPGFFGIVRRLRAAGLECVVHPVPSAVSLAFGRLGLPWEEAQVVSAHGRDLRRALNVVRAHAPVAVMTGSAAGIRELAAGLLGDWERRLVLLERLGDAAERIRVFTAAEALLLDPGDIGEPNLVIALAEPRDPDLQDPEDPEEPISPPPPWRLGGLERPRPPWFDEVVRQDVLAALVAGALGPGPGDLAWCAGAFAGHVQQHLVERGCAILLDAFPPLAAPTRPASAAALPAWREADVLFVGLHRVDGDALAALRAMIGALHRRTSAGPDPLHARPRVALAVTAADGAAADDQARRLAAALPERSWRFLPVPAAVPIAPDPIGADPAAPAAAESGSVGARAPRATMPPPVPAAAAAAGPAGPTGPQEAPHVRLLLSGPDPATISRAPSTGTSTR